MALRACEAASLTALAPKNSRAKASSVSGSGTRRWRRSAGVAGAEEVEGARFQRRLWAAAGDREKMPATATSTATSTGFGAEIIETSGVRRDGRGRRRGGPRRDGR